MEKVPIEKEVSLIIGSDMLTMRGEWEFEDQTPENAHLSLNSSEVNFNYLININDTNNLIHPQDVDYINSLLHDLKQNKEVDYSFRVITTSGEIKPLRGTGKIKHNASPLAGTFMYADLDDVKDNDELELKIFKYSEWVSDTGNWSWNLQTGDLLLSENFIRLLGGKPEGIKTGWKLYIDHVHEDDRQFVSESILKIKETHESLDIEHRIMPTDGMERYARLRGEYFVTRKQNQYFIGTYQDITDKKDYEKELNKTNALLESVMDKTSSSIMVLKAIRNEENKIEDFEYVFTNTRTLESLNRDTLVGKKFCEEFPIAKSLGLFDHYVNVTETGNEWKDEVHVQDGATDVWSKVYACKFNDGVLVTYVDITEKKEAALALNKSRELLQSVFESSLCMLSVFTSVRNQAGEIIDFKYVLVNSLARNQEGQDPVGKLFTHLHPDAMATMVLEKFKAVVDTGIIADFELEETSDDIQSWHRIRAARIGDGLVSTAENITERKRNEQAIKTTRARFEAAIRVSPFSSFILTSIRDEQDSLVDLKFDYASPASYNLFGYDATDACLLKDFPNVKKIGLYENLIRTLETGEPTDAEYFYKGEGLNIWLNWKAVRLGDGLFVTAEDISKRKKIALEIQTAKERLEAAFNVSSNALSIVKAIRDKEGKIVDFLYEGLNQKAIRINGFNATGFSLREALPQYVTMGLFDLFVNAVEYQTTVDYEGVFDRPEKICIRLIATKLEDGLFISMEDISERKKTEETIRQMLHGSVSAICLLDSVFDDKGRVQDFICRAKNNAAEKILPADYDYTGKRLSELLPDLYHTSLVHFAKVVETGNAKRILHHTLKNGNESWCDVSIVRNGNGIILTLHDITQTKKTEREVIESKQLLQSVLERLNEAQAIGHTGSFEWSVTDNKIHWSDEMYRIHGLEPNTEGMTFEKVIAFIHPDDQLWMNDLILNSRKVAGEQRNVLHRLIKRDGSIRYISQHWQSIADQDGNVIRIAGMAQDVTDIKEAETQLHKNFQTLREIEAVANIGSWEYDIKQNCFSWSNGMYALFHLRAGTNVTPETFIDFCIPEDRYVAEKIVNCFRYDPKPFEETIQVKPNGEIKTLIVRGMPLADLSGKFSRIVGIGFDITEIKKSQKEIHDRAHFVKRVAATIPDLIGVVELSTHHLEFVSDASLAHFGFEAAEMKSMTPEQRMTLIHHDDLPGMKKYFDSFYSISDDENVTLDYRAKNKNGKWLWFRVRGKVFRRDASGHTTHCINIIQNITEHKKAQDELNEKHQRLLEAQNLGRLGSYEYDVATNTMRWSDELYEIMGTARRKILSFEKVLSFYRPIDATRLKENIQAAIDTGKGFEMEAAFVRENDKEIRYLFVKAETTQNRNGKTTRLRGVAQDITERKKNELELNAMNKQLSNFAFVASHDLREPLRKIQVFSNLLLEKESMNISERGKEYFQKIVGSVKRMNALIDDILQFSHISSPVNLKTEDIDLNEVLQRVLQDLQDSIDLYSVQIHKAKLPILRGNALQISQLFQNLITNAIKFQSPGNVPVIHIRAKKISGNKITSRQANANKVYLQLRVCDNGIGFEKKYTRQIFQMFQRLHTQSEYAGTGMGLAICKKIVENHKGFIRVKSTPGKGSVFSCYFELDE